MLEDRLAVLLRRNMRRHGGTFEATMGLERVGKPRPRLRILIGLKFYLASFGLCLDHNYSGFWIYFWDVSEAPARRLLE